ncbi:glycine cleavage system protein GcvH [Streptomyces melanogenes]|uniref:Glycine cleavage system H protein n=1 Tax=Streptomyces melanogenes TaxID=67326 RepID=A0ABZ1XDX7_9ACTN|nr:glycine cleavage system protein GcvH [Streptomyces melanogenes]
MSNIPTDLRYTLFHQWVRDEGDGVLAVGLTDYARQALGDIEFLELPDPGKTVSRKEAVGTVESVKAANDIYAPLAGEITATNAEAVATPQSVNTDPYSVWLFKLAPSQGEPTDDLLTAEQYQAAIGG